MLAALLVSASAFAQDNSTGNGEGTASTDCTWTFSTGSGATRLVYCVSSHGNIMQFQSPQGSEHIRVGTFVEGYVLCSGTTILAHDVGFFESGWAPGTTVLAGPSGAGITLRRITSDFNWQLDQKFSRDVKELDVTVLMTLKNNGPTVNDVRLARVVDMDINNDFSDDTQDRSDRGVFGRDSSLIGFTLTNVAFNQFVDTAVVGFGPACSPASLATPTTSDSTSVVTARIGPMNNGVSKKTTFVYRRQ